MSRVCSFFYVGTALVIGVSAATAVVAQLVFAAPQPSIAGLAQLDPLPVVVAPIKAPELKDPDWLRDAKTAEIAASRRTTAPAASSLGGKRIVTYDVLSRGSLHASLGEFKQQADATLNDPRGWSRLGVHFSEVPSGGQFTLVLSEAGQVPSFSSSGCDSQYSCRVGRYVIINQDRWVSATSSWNSSGGSLREYRHMVINHETGHWLGHGHATCQAGGQAAQVMQQQSISLQGCGFNAWPASSELWSTQLGIG